MGKLKLMTIIGTRPEIIRLSATIKCCDRYFEQILVHTGQNYDYTLNQVFFDDLGLRAPDFYLNAVGDDLGATIGNIIERSYKPFRFRMTSLHPRLANGRLKDYFWLIARRNAPTCCSPTMSTTKLQKKALTSRYDRYMTGLWKWGRGNREKSIAI